MSPRFPLKKRHRREISHCTVRPWNPFFDFDQLEREFFLFSWEEPKKVSVMHLTKRIFSTLGRKGSLDYKDMVTFGINSLPSLFPPKKEGSFEPHFHVNEIWRFKVIRMIYEEECEGKLVKILAGSKADVCSN